MKLNSRILLLTGVFIAFLCVMGYQAFETEDALHAERIRIHDQTSGAEKLALTAQVHFKKQVQEWKNVLLRGRDPEMYDQYHDQFLAEEMATRVAIQELLKQLDADSPARSRTEEFLEAHTQLAAAYRGALETFNDPSVDQPHFRADEAVRGIDRKPTELLDLVVRKVDDERREELAMVAEESRRKNERLRISVLIGVTLAFLALFKFLQIFVAQPILNSISFAKAIAGGNLNQEMAIRSHDEIGEMQEALITMQAKLRNSYDDLRDANDTMASARDEAVASATEKSRLLQRIEEKNHELTHSLDELRQSEGRFGILFNNSPLGVGLLSETGDLEACNRRMRELLPQSSKRPATACCEPLVEQILENRRQEFRKLFAELDKAGGAAVVERVFPIPSPEGPDRQFRFILSRIAETRQVALFLDDVTKQQELENRLIRKEKSAMLESLVGGIAHELNNKLAPVQGFSEILLQKVEQEVLPDKFSQPCRIIAECADEAARIIRQLVQLSKQAPTDLALHDLGMIARDALDVMQFELRNAEVAVFRELPDEAFPVLVDAGQVKQVIANLTLNAIDAMEFSDRKELKVRLLRDGQRARLDVSDTGLGISQTMQRRIFDPFFTTKGPDRGTGLGLAVCLSIVKQLNGELLLESTPQRGSTFSILFELSSERAADGLEPEMETESRSATSEAEKRRILIADDEEYFGGLMREILHESFPCEVEWVKDGQMAIERLENGRFDLVISDVRMPRVDGVELYDWVSQHCPSLENRFLFVTGDLRSDTETLGVGQLPAPFVSKPFSPAKLSTECRVLLET